MRPKLAIGVLAAGFLVIGMLFLVRQRSARQPITQQVQSPAKEEVGKEPRSVTRTNRPDQSPGTEPNALQEQHEAYVESRIAELMELGMKDDSTSLETILGELTNRDPEIRKAALDAAVQFGSRDAIPKLMDAASQTDDSKEKTEILEAVEFLKLPSLSETIADAKASKTTRVWTPKANPTPAKRSKAW